MIKYTNIDIKRVINVTVQYIYIQCKSNYCKHKLTKIEQKP